MQKTLLLLVMGYVLSLQPLDLKIPKIQDIFNLLEQNYYSQTPGKKGLRTVMSGQFYVEMASKVQRYLLEKWVQNIIRIYLKPEYG